MSNEAAPADSQAAASAANETVCILLKDGTRANVDPRKIVAHDFRSRGALSQADMRNVEALCQRYVRNLGARLSIFLRMECALKFGTLTVSPFSKFCESMPVQSCVTMFGIEQMRGVGIMDLRLPLALAMADRLLGGKGRAPEEARLLTEIEMTLLDDAIQSVLAGWADLWAGKDQRLQARIIGHETSGRGIQTAAGEEQFLLLTIEATMGETASQFQVGVPVSMIEYSVRKMEQAQEPNAGEKRAKPAQWRKPYAGIAVPIFAEWKVREMALGETLNFNKGDIIELPGALINHARIRLSEVETYVGTVGIQNGHVAVQITGASSND